MGIGIWLALFVRFISSSMSVSIIFGRLQFRLRITKAAPDFGLVRCSIFGDFRQFSWLLDAALLWCFAVFVDLSNKIDKFAPIQLHMRITITGWDILPSFWDIFAPAFGCTIPPCYGDLQLLLNLLKIRPRWLQHGLKVSHGGPRWRQGGPKMPPGRPSCCPRWPKMAQKWFQYGFPAVQDGPRRPKMVPRCPTCCPSRALARRAFGENSLQRPCRPRCNWQDISTIGGSLP